MSELEMAQLVHDVANELGKREGETWLVRGSVASRGFGTDVYNAKGETVNFQESRTPGRLYIEGMDPVGHRATDCDITVAVSRSPAAIAAEIARRVLPGYRVAMAERRRREAERQAAFRARAAAVNAVEAMFGPPTDFGELDPAASGEVTYKTGARLPLRGKRLRENWQGKPLYDHEFARVTVTGDGSLMDVEMRDIPAEVAARMLAVLAAYNATWPARAECCEQHGSPHPGEWSVPGCPQEGTDGPAAFFPRAGAFAEMYDAWLAEGEGRPFTDWLKSAIG